MVRGDNFFHALLHIHRFSFSVCLAVSLRRIVYHI